MRELSAGAVLFKRSNEIKYLLLYREAHDHYKANWDLPKGNVEQEDSVSAIRREIREETGLEGVKILNGFKERIKFFYRKGDLLINKEVIFLLAETGETNVKLSLEHQDYKWVNLDEAVKLMKYKNYQELFRKAEEFIKKHVEQKSLREFR